MSSAASTGVPTGTAGVVPHTDRSVCGSSAVSARWYVLRTRSRQEQAAAATTEASGGRCYVPTIRQVKYYGHRKRVSDVPLFPCYAFMWGSVEHAYEAISLKRIVQVLPVPDQAYFEHELAQIRRALEGCAELSPYRFFVRGRRVRVTAGPFEGIEGIVEEGPRQNRLILQVHAIGRALSLEIDASLLEIVD